MFKTYDATDKNLVQALYTHLTLNDSNTLVFLENELFTFDYDKRFGMLNSAFLDMLATILNFNANSTIYKSYNKLRHDLCYANIIKVPDLINNRHDVKCLQAKIAALADNELF